MEDLLDTCHACDGAAMEEKIVMNFLQYYVALRKLLTSVTVFGLDQFKMTSTLEGYIFNSPPQTMCPKYTKEVFPNSHFENFKNNSSFFKISSTLFT